MAGASVQKVSGRRANAGKWSGPCPKSRRNDESRATGFVSAHGCQTLTQTVASSCSMSEAEKRGPENIHNITPTINQALKSFSDSGWHCLLGFAALLMARCTEVCFVSRCAGPGSCDAARDCSLSRLHHVKTEL